jgi:hypothetical protein
MATASFISRRSSALESLNRRCRPTIDIKLSDDQIGYISSYTTLDKIQGEVTLTSEYDIRFDEVSITFEGRDTELPRPHWHHELTYLLCRHFENGC